MTSILVQRCGSCKHWARTYKSVAYASSFGECSLNTTTSSLDWYSERLAVAYEAPFYVRPEFGCVKWEAKT